MALVEYLPRLLIIIDLQHIWVVFVGLFTNLWFISNKYSKRFCPIFGRQIQETFRKQARQGVAMINATGSLKR